MVTVEPSRRTMHVHPAQRPAVAQHVGQRFLHDPVHGQLEGRVARAAPGRCGSSAPAGPRCGSRPAALPKLSPAASGSAGRVPAARRPAGPQDPAHVRQRGPARSGTVRPAPRAARSGSLRTTTAAPSDRADHDGQRVGHDVVHFPGDPVAFVDGAQAGGPGRPRGDLLLVLAPLPHRDADARWR